MSTKQTPESLTELLVSLMPGGDDRSMWRDHMASALEQVAATDDLTLLRAAKGADKIEVGFMEFVSNFPGVEIVPASELTAPETDAAIMETKIVSDGKIPVFEYHQMGESPLDECLGWVIDEAQACELLLRESEVVKKGIGNSVFGGIINGHIRVATDNGPNRDAKGLYRWQPCFYPFFDTVENAGMLTPLDNVYIYKR